MNKLFVRENILIIFFPVGNYCDRFHQICLKKEVNNSVFQIIKKKKIIFFFVIFFFPQNTKIKVAKTLKKKKVETQTEQKHKQTYSLKIG